MPENTKVDVKIPVKKGDRLLIEVEFHKDMDLYQDASILIQSLYGKECLINDEFKVVNIRPRRDEDTIKNMVVTKLEGIIDEILLM